MIFDTSEFMIFFQDCETKLNNLIKTASTLNNDLKETLHLDDIISLLEGDVERVKMKKLPFIIFHKDEIEPNLII